MSIKKQAVSGVKWTTVSTITLAISALLKISVLARFLEPEDFGLMALITFVLGFMDLFMDMGITTAILHKQNITRNEYSSLYWLNVGFSLILFGVIVGLSPLIASFYNEYRLTELIPLSGLVIVFSAVGRQFKTILQKELKFKKMAIIDIGSVIIALIFAIIFAANGYGVYALVYSALIQYGINNMLYFILGSKLNAVMFYFNFTETKPFLKIGIYQVGGQVVNYVNRDLDVLIIGKFLGAEILGGYSLAKQLVRRPIAIIDSIINKVAISILPKYQGDNKRLLKYFNKLIGSLSTINAFVYGAIAIAAPFAVSVLYGDDYEHIVPLVILFTVIVYFRSVSGLVGILSVTKGRTDLEFYWNIIIAVVMPLVMFISVNRGVEFIVFLLGLAQMLLVFPLWYIFYYKQINMSLTMFARRVFPPFTIAIIAYTIYKLIGVESIVAQLLACGILAIIILITAIVLDKEVLSFIKSNKYVKSYIKNK